MQNYTAKGGYYWSLKVHKGVLYAGHSSAGLFYSLDTGKTWTRMNGEAPHRGKLYEKGIFGATAMTFDNNDYLWVGPYKSGPYVTSDMGKTWILHFSDSTDMGYRLTNEPIKDIIIQDSILYINCQNLGVIFSKIDNRETYNFLNAETPSFWITITHFKEFGGDIYGAGYGGDGDTRSGYLEVCKLNKEKNKWEVLWKAGTQENPHVEPIGFTMCNDVIYKFDIDNDTAVSYSKDGGKTFIKFNNGLEDLIKWYYSLNHGTRNDTQLFKHIFTNGEYLFLSVCPLNSQGRFDIVYRAKLDENCLPVIETPVEEATIAETVKPYPNPASDLITVELPEGALQAVNYEVYNALGEKVILNKYPEINGNKIEIDVSPLSPGVYYFSYLSGGKRLRAQFIKR